MTKGKLILLCGISGSGKSTFTSLAVQHNPEKYIAVNRDKLREALYSYTEESVKEYYHRGDLHKLEQQITDVEDLLIEKFLEEGKSVIVDSTKLRAKYLNRFNKFNFDKEIIFFNIALKETLIRNSSRKRQVDEDIIIKQYDSYVELRKFLENNKLKFEYDLQEISASGEATGIL